MLRAWALLAFSHRDFLMARSTTVDMIHDCVMSADGILILTKVYHGVRLCLIGAHVLADPFLEYSFVAPHDMESLIDRMGGPDTFESRLDMMVRRHSHSDYSSCLRLT